jgi:hypothetical protein
MLGVRRGSRRRIMVIDRAQPERLMWKYDAVAKEEHRSPAAPCHGPDEGAQGIQCGVAAA